MRKQTKVAAIVSAAALLVIGASMTSMASVKGTWMMVDGEWMCYDSNGDPYEDVFASSNGKDFYLGDDGYLVRSSWVDYDGDMYFVNSSGQKITNDWRLTVPYDDDDDEEEWFYFQSTGKMASSKKITYKGNTYYFDADGKMLTGWVSSTDGNNVDEASGFDDGNTYYCDENGARLKNAWIYDTEPGTDDDDADADEYWYYIKGSGKPATGKQSNIKGQTYLFDDEAHMLYGWVADVDAESSSNGDWEHDKHFVQLTSRDDDEIGEAKNLHPDSYIYYCGEEDDGHAKKSKWVKTFEPDNEDGDDGDEYWYWFDKSGRLYRAGDTDGESALNGMKFKFDDGELFRDKAARPVSSKKVNSKTYWFNDEGQMLSKFYMIEQTAGEEDYELFYFGGSDDGSMKTGSQSIEDDSGDNYKFYFYTKDTEYGTQEAGDYVKYDKGAGVTGNKNNKLYYYGLLIQADDYRYQIADVKDENGGEHYFIINTSGTIQHAKNNYTDDGDDIIKAKDAEFDSEGDQWKYEIKDLSTLEYYRPSCVIDVDNKVDFKN